jgi:hypothetical protein
MPPHRPVMRWWVSDELRVDVSIMIISREMKKVHHSEQHLEAAFAFEKDVLIAPGTRRGRV